MTVTIRQAVPADAELIHRFVLELATYEREPQAVIATPDDYRAQLAAPRPPFECLIASLDSEPVGFALFFHNYSTWTGRQGLYLEDLYVTPAARGRGVGESLLRKLAALAVERGCARFEWAVLDWNEPAIAFYRRLGAQPMEEWTVFRVRGEALVGLAEGASPPGAR
jgi:GNAT superfamily N-acetyltransferase